MNKLEISSDPRVSSVELNNMIRENPENRHPVINDALAVAVGEYFDVEDFKIFDAIDDIWIDELSDRDNRTFNTAGDYDQLTDHTLDRTNDLLISDLRDQIIYLAINIIQTAKAWSNQGAI
jgi:hypothetical protein